MNADPESIELRLARRLLELRRESRLTLTALSEKCGISAPHLSRLEKGDRQPSIGALLQLARVYDMSLSQLVEEETDESYHLIRSGSGITHEGADGTYTVLSGPGPGLSVVEISVSKRKSKPVRHDGQEWLQVMRGTIAFALGTETIELSSGDAIQFDASVPHSLRPTSKAPVQILLVSTTASRTLPH